MGSLHAAEAGLYSGVWVGGGQFAERRQRGKCLHPKGGRRVSPVLTPSPPATHEPLRPFVSSHLWEPVLQNGARMVPGEAYRKVSETKGSACPRTALDINRQAGRAEPPQGINCPPRPRVRAAPPPEDPG